MLRHWSSVTESKEMTWRSWSREAVRTRKRVGHFTRWARTKTFWRVHVPLLGAMVRRTAGAAE